MDGCDWPGCELPVAFEVVVDGSDHFAYCWAHGRPAVAEARATGAEVRFGWAPGVR
jgi:hypothetical protein